MGKWQINNKFHKNLLLKKNAHLISALPVMKEFNEENLASMLQTYKTVIVKPVKGSAGKGIFKISLLDDSSYELKIMKKVKKLNQISAVFKYLAKKNNVHSPFLIQQYIFLLADKGNPVDYRVITQRLYEGKSWEVTGKYARIAQDGYMLTNFAHGASIVPVEDQLHAHPNKSELLDKLDNIALSAAESLSHHFYKHCIWGCDLGIDVHGKVWIIEINSQPQIKGFLEHQALLPMHQKILNYKAKRLKAKKAQR
ncbi:YheC/YheD family protein [Thalassobacillus pellis]|uniref:YheC/YheD family protein n=1 Tax=Thalassobacillus pellis TaxID=748008 RepID=UPI00195F2CFB|nr:YheC/YheD family protein [Thalassobacillus pellis]MBM7552579.1 glutathione synthase/RimK-type ligase-like ATP-grasp enzyme [Thalassobacillus pellis]